MATTNSLQSISVPLPIFYGSDYDLWGKKMETLFRSQNLWDIVKNGFEEPENISTLEEAQRKELEVKKQKDASALYLIQQSLANTIFLRITKASTAQRAWDMLQEEFRGDSERANMGSTAILDAPYKAAMYGDWKSMIDYCKENTECLDSPVTSSSDTVLHLALQSNEVQPLEDLLEIVKKGQLPLTEEDFLKRKNKFGNTVLHEATINGNYEAVRFLVERCPDLLKEKNNYGETPLFTAAAFGEAEIVGFLIRSKPEECVYDKNTHDDDGLLFPKQCVDDDDDDDGLLFPIHRQRKDGLSILGAAIIGQHFETALLLLELDGSLHRLQDKKGITALQLLAHMPSAFESGFPMGIFERLIYCCLPVRRKVKFQVETVGDVESGLGSSLERKPRGGLLNYFKVPKGIIGHN